MIHRWISRSANRLNAYEYNIETSTLLARIARANGNWTCCTNGVKMLCIEIRVSNAILFFIHHALCVSVEFENERPLASCEHCRLAEKIYHEFLMKIAYVQNEKRWGFVWQTVELEWAKVWLHQTHTLVQVCRCVRAQRDLESKVIVLLVTRWMFQCWTDREIVFCDLLWFLWLFHFICAI